MGNLLNSNEPTLEDKLRNQLCRIVYQYEKLELICGYIAIFKMTVASQHTIPHNVASPDNNLSATPNHSNSSALYPGTHSMHHNNYNHYHNGHSIHHQNDNDHHYQQNEHHHHHHHNHSNHHNHHHHNSSTRSNLVKVKEKKEIQKITDLDYRQFCEWKIEEIMRNNPNITEQELKENHGLVLNSSSNNIFTAFSSSKGTSSIFKDDEKESLLIKQQQEQKENKVHDIDNINTNNIHDIKNILVNNDIKSSVQSLGDTTDQLCEILDRAKILHKIRNNLNNKIIHIRGNKQTIFSYYLILNKYIIISYAQSKSEYLGFMEWIKIQSKLEKLEVTLKNIEKLLNGEKKN